MRWGAANRRFDRWAATYDRSILQSLLFEPTHQVALKAGSALGPPPRDVLDVGCGTGRLLEAAGDRWKGAHCTGVDLSEDMLAEARRKHEGDGRFTFSQGDASSLPLESASFDLVLSTMSFHHWSDQVAGVREIARVLRPRGLFVLADVDFPLVPILRPLAGWTGRANLRTPDAIQGFLEQAGLSVLVRHRFWPLLRAQLFVARRP
ncbi:MAG TPA: methyltransferase domain-containing protein [Anaeromyxobacter sp.]|nr:methyltransferase domain-containing protein [Anaeromyxobacter sp.]